MHSHSHTRPDPTPRSTVEPRNPAGTFALLVTAFRIVPGWSIVRLATTVDESRRRGGLLARGWDTRDAELFERGLREILPEAERVDRIVAGAITQTMGHACQPTSAGPLGDEAGIAAPETERTGVRGAA